MTAELLIELAWKSVLTAGLTLAALYAFRHRSAGERSWIGHLGLLAIASLPLSTTLLRPWQVSPSPQIAGAFLEPLSFTFDKSSGSADLPSAGSAAALQGIPQVHVETLAFWAYSIPAAVMLALVFLSVGRLGFIRRRAAVLADKDWLSALARAQIRMNFKHGTALLVSKDVTSPVSWGLFRPVILLDRGAAGERAQAEAIIAHELAHVTRLDWPKLILGRVVRAVYWFNPLVWVLARQCHELREHAADDSVLRSEVSKADYAELLVRAARHENRGLLLAANGVAPSRGSLARRISRILDSKAARSPARVAFCGVSVLATSIIAAPLSAVTLSGRPEQPMLLPSPALQPPALPPLPQALPPAPPPPLSENGGSNGSGVSLPESQLLKVATTLQASETLGLARFDAVELRDAGELIVRPGSVRTLRIVRGSKPAKVALDASGRLYIIGCKSCRNEELRVELTTPTVQIAAVAGNGRITFDGGFARLSSLDANVRGSGTVDVRSLDAVNVNAAVKGEGRILTRARVGLMAAIIGRGSITYWGSPTVTSAVIGGGSVTQAGT